MLSAKNKMFLPRSSRKYSASVTALSLKDVVPDLIHLPKNMQCFQKITAFERSVQLWPSRMRSPMPVKS